MIKSLLPPPLFSFPFDSLPFTPKSQNSVPSSFVSVIRRLVSLYIRSGIIKDPLDEFS